VEPYDSSDAVDVGGFQGRLEFFICVVGDPVYVGAYPKSTRKQIVDPLPNLYGGSCTCQGEQQVLQHEQLLRQLHQTQGRATGAGRYYWKTRLASTSGLKHNLCGEGRIDRLSKIAQVVKRSL
jgi:hypothetical protein